MGESDGELVQRTRRGDRQAFAGLVERYEQPALVVASSILHSWHDARDVVQDSFVIAYERLNKLWSPHNFGAWFIQIVRRRALLHVRRAKSRLVPLLAAAGAEQIHAPDTDVELAAR